MSQPPTQAADSPQRRSSDLDATAGAAPADSTASPYRPSGRVIPTCIVEIAEPESASWPGWLFFLFVGTTSLALWAFILFGVRMVL
ncbi:MAG: hypothetical protein MI920_15935 [Kiloniellales bacterium]|nr:hypothetical protein [Kiloniellales bacterium]